MAGNAMNLLLLLMIIFIASSNFFIIPTHQLSSSRKEHYNMTKTKITRLHFYLYDKPSTPDPTGMPIVAGPNNNSTLFGSLAMIDDPLLAGPRVDAKIIGRAQGMFGGADMKTIGLLMVVNYVFTDGKYNGSTLSVLGRNEVFQSTREMPIVGGTGLFRFAQGYAVARTVWFNTTSGDALVNYTVTVRHYAQS